MPLKPAHAFRLPTGCLLAPLLFAALMTRPARAASDVLSFYKTQFFDQAGTNLPAVPRPDTLRPPYGFTGGLLGPGSTRYERSQVILENGRSISLGVGTYQGQDFNPGASDSLSSFEAAHPDGAHAFGTITTNGVTHSTTLRLSDVPYPLAPRIRNVGLLTTNQLDLEMLLAWDAFSGGTTNDFIFISDRGGAGLLTPLPGRAGALDGTRTSAVIPAHHYWNGGSLLVTFIKVADRGTNTSGDLLVLAGKAAATALTFGSTSREPSPGGTATNAPRLRASFPEDGATEVPSRMSAIFEFDQLMETNIAIAWSTNLDATKFSYEWSHFGTNGSQLSCTYSDRLPGLTRISWTLNPPDHASAPFTGGNGMALESGRHFGSFTTCATNSTSIRHVSLNVARQFAQSGSHPPEETPIAELLPSLTVYFALDGETETGAEAAVTLPNGVAQTTDAIEEWGQGFAHFVFDAEVLGELQAAHVTADYRLDVDFGGGVTDSAILTASLDQEPAPPRILDLPEAQRIDVGKDFVLRWEAMGVDGWDQQSLSLYREDDLGSHECPARPSSFSQVELPPESRSLLIPAGGLLPGATYHGTLSLGRGSAQTINRPAPAEGWLWADHHLQFTLKTLGGPCDPRELELLPAGLPEPRVNEPYQAAFVATGAVAPVRWETLLGSDFPPGLKLTQDGLIVGTPLVSGIFDLAVKATDSTSLQFDTQAGRFGTRSFRLEVRDGAAAPPPSLSFRLLSPTQYELSFSSRPGVSYFVVRSADFLSWQRGEEVMGTGDIVRQMGTWSTEPGGSFFRVEVE